MKFLIAFFIVSVCILCVHGGMFGASGYYENGRPVVKIEDQVYPADTNNVQQIGSGQDCKKCFINAPQGEGQNPDFECQTASPAIQNNKVVYVSPCDQ